MNVEKRTEYFLFLSRSDNFFDWSVLQWENKKDKPWKESVKEMFKKGGKLAYDVHLDTMVIHVGGEIDHHSAVCVRTEMDERLLAERPAKVLLELSAVDFMDSSGLGLIMGRLALVRQYGGTLAVLDPSPAVMKMLQLAGMDRMVSVLQTKDEKRKGEEA